MSSIARRPHLLLALLVSITAGTLAETSTPAEDPDETAEPRHGGLLAQTGADERMELVTTGPVTLLYVYDKQMRPVRPAELPGELTVLAPDLSRQDRPLVPAGDVYKAAIDLTTGNKYKALATLRIGERTLTARFSPESAAAAQASLALRKQTPEQAASPSAERGRVHGRLIDSTCLANGELPSDDHTECAVRCIRAGAPIAIVEDGTHLVYVALAAKEKSPSELLLPYVGKHSLFTGRFVRQGGSSFFLVEDVATEHDHTAYYGGMVAMAGDFHTEVLMLESGEVRLYVSDAYRKLLPVFGMSGSAEAREGAGSVRTATLRPDPTNQFLQARFEPPKAKMVELTTRLPLADNPKFFITFMVEPQASPRRVLSAPTAVARTQPEPAAVSSRPSSASNPAATPATSSAGAIPEIRIDVKGGYKPDELALQKGVPVRLRFVRFDSGACASELLMPDFKVKKELAPLAETVVDITPTEAGEFEFTCGMKMMRGWIQVRE